MSKAPLLPYSLHFLSNGFREWFPRALGLEFSVSFICGNFLGSTLKVSLLQLYNASHIMFCPISRRFISLSALGNLDNSSFGTSTLLAVAGCCFDVHDDICPIFFLLVVLLPTVRRLTGLKLDFFDVTTICFYRNNKEMRIMDVVTIV